MLFRSNDEIIGDTALTKLLCCRQICGMYNINKLNYLKSIIDSTLDRLIIFYNFQSECDEIIKICKEKKREVSIVNGKERDLEAYENCDNSITLIQYQAGAMGLNLQKSNKIIYYTLPLSSELFEQSKKRIHRIGQSKTCCYYYLTIKNTVEEDIYQTLLLQKN